MSMIGNALDYLHGIVHDPDVAGELITIRRSTDTCSAYAVIGRPPLPPQSMLGYEPGGLDMAQSSPENTDHVFFVLTSAYKPTGTVTLPAAGDQVLRTVNSVTSLYELAAPQSGGRAWELIDDNKRLKLNSKFMGTE